MTLPLAPGRDVGIGVVNGVLVRLLAADEIESSGLREQNQHTDCVHIVTVISSHAHPFLWQCYTFLYFPGG